MNFRYGMSVALVVALSGCASKDGVGNGVVGNDKPAFSQSLSAASPNADQNTVRSVQRRLVALGFDVGLIDGLYGARTANAIAAFQRDTRMTPIDGQVTPQLLSAIDDELAAMASAELAAMASAEQIPAINSDVLAAVPGEDESTVLAQSSSLTISPEQTAVAETITASSKAQSSADSEFERQTIAMSVLVDDWINNGRRDGLNGLTQWLDFRFGKIVTGNYTDYLDQPLSQEALKMLPAIGRQFLNQATTIRDLEKVVGALYFSALAIGGEDELIGVGKQNSLKRAHKGSTTGAKALRADANYDWQAQVKIPLGVAAYRVGATLLGSPNYLNNPDTAQRAYHYLSLALKNGVQDAAFLLNQIYSSGYGAPAEHQEGDALDTAKLSLNQVVEVCDLFFDSANPYNWIDRHPMPPRPDSCVQAKEGLEAARADLNEQAGATRAAKAEHWFATVSTIASIPPESSYQSASGNDNPSIVDISNYGASSLMITEK